MGQIAQLGIIDVRQRRAGFEGDAKGVATAPGKPGITNETIANDDETEAGRQLHALCADNFCAAMRQVANTAIEDTGAAAENDNASQQHSPALIGPAFWRKLRAVGMDVIAQADPP